MAVARNQLQVLNLLLSQEKIDVNLGVSLHTYRLLDQLINSCLSLPSS